MSWVEKFRKINQRRGAGSVYQRPESNEFVISSFSKNKKVKAIVKNCQKAVYSSKQLSPNKSLQAFFIRIYNMQKRINVNKRRCKIFSKKFGNEEKTVDRSVLPPFELMLRLHWERINSLAVIPKKGTTSHFQFSDAMHYSWNNDNSILWVKDTTTIY